MASLENYLDDLLARGRGYLSRQEAVKAIGFSETAFSSAASRLIKRHRLANLRHGFYLILRPEDRAAGAPDPVQWIDPLMKYQGIDYRISLLRAAAFHGSSHQAAMVFQLVVPKQIRAFSIGRHRLQFIYQASASFVGVNILEWVGQLKSDAGFAKVAGVELTLLDCARYFHRAGGINGIAQIAKDIGANADPRKLAKTAEFYENSSVRRLGYLLELVGHQRQAKSLEVFVCKAKSTKPLDPAVKAISASLATMHEKNLRWKLAINTQVELDS